MKITRKVRSLKLHTSKRYGLLEKSTVRKPSSLDAKDSTISIITRGNFKPNRDSLKRYCIKGEKKTIRIKLSIKNELNRIVPISKIQIHMKYKKVRRRRYERVRRLR